MDLFLELYKTDKLKTIFGNKFIGPKRLKHARETLIAKYKEDKTNDGHGVEIYCEALPAEFFTIKALNSVNSMNESIKGFTLTTGSGLGNEVKKIAELINEGMLGLKKDNNK